MQDSKPLLTLNKVHPDIGETFFQYSDGLVIYHRTSKTMLRLENLLSEIFTFCLDHPQGLSDADIIKLKCGESTSKNNIADINQALSGLKSKNIIVNENIRPDI